MSSNVMHYLHSIMYLLIQITRFINIHGFFLFTFHNVSINSGDEGPCERHQKKFTFHNVSINSAQLAQCCCDNKHLHSIMYLLIPETVR